MKANMDEYYSTVQKIEDAIKQGVGLRVKTGDRESTLYGVELGRFMDELSTTEPVSIMESVRPRSGDAEATYAWTITIDHKALEASDNTDWGAIWTTGPGEPSEQQKAMLSRGAPLTDDYERHTFRLYDANNTLCYTGCSVMQEPTESALEAPLREFGASAGATRIEWEWHPDRPKLATIGEKELEAIRQSYQRDLPPSNVSAKDGHGETFERPAMSMHHDMRAQSHGGMDRDM